MVDISKKNGLETVADNDEILWLNEKYIKGGLDHKNLREITIKYHSVIENTDMN